MLERTICCHLLFNFSENQLCIQNVTILTTSKMDKFIILQLVQKLRNSAENCSVYDECIKAKLIHWSYEMNIFMYKNKYDCDSNDNVRTNYSLEEELKNQIQQQFCGLLHVFANENPHFEEIAIEDYINLIYKSDRAKNIVNWHWLSGDILEQITFFIISTFCNALNNY